MEVPKLQVTYIISNYQMETEIESINVRIRRLLRGEALFNIDQLDKGHHPGCPSAALHHRQSEGQVRVLVPCVSGERGWIRCTSRHGEHIAEDTRK